MENKHTPSPDSEEYNVEKPQDLNAPEYTSASDKRESDELPAIENMNDEDEKVQPEDSNRSNMPKTDLGNEEDDADSERIIRR
ncbi:MAG: hypothetical protein EOO92_09655 [Pedobacter sp.]|nr:MAG: hypothetical protein EOO92_09655 [Pedobacter sp.]